MSKILDFLPPYFRDNATLKGLAEAAGRPFDLWRSRVGALSSYLDPDGAPADWLDWLMHVVGLPPNAWLSDRRKRNLIRNAGKILREKGIESGLEAYVEAVAGVSADVVERNTHAFIAGVSVAGDICGPGVNAWTYEIKVPTGSIAESELRDLLEPFAPLFCTYTVTFV